MNAKQAKVMWVVIILLLLLVLFPPWLGNKPAVGGVHNPHERTDGFMGFHFAFSRPSYRQRLGSVYETVNGETRQVHKAHTATYYYQNARIDYGRFTLATIGVLLITGGLLFKYRTRTND